MSPKTCFRDISRSRQNSRVRQLTHVGGHGGVGGLAQTARSANKAPNSREAQAPAHEPFDPPGALTESGRFSLRRPTAHRFAIGGTLFEKCPRGATRRVGPFVFLDPFAGRARLLASRGAPFHPNGSGGASPSQSAIPSSLGALVVRPPRRHPQIARKTAIFATCQTRPPSAKIVDSRSEAGPQ
jgi:hypothetical protein